LVSIVLRDVPGASEATRAHVKAVAARLGYVPDARAQALRGQASKAVGVSFESNQPFHADLVDYLYDAAGAAGFQLVLSAVTPRRDESAAIESLLANRCGAVVALGSRLPPARLAHLATRLPVVVVARPVRAAGVEYVCSDDARGLRLAVQHLAGLGHTRIAFAESLDSPGNPARRRGYLAALKAIAAAPDFLPGGPTEEAGATAGRELLARPDRPTAVIAFNDRCAAGLQDTLSRAGLSLPEDLSLVGIDDSSLANVSYRQLTSVHQDVDLLARTAIARAVARLTPQSPDQTAHTIPVTLTVRASTAPPKNP
jgi:DNA-binding LacI/PurR family transcriptional regulator